MINNTTKLLLYANNPNTLLFSHSPSFSLSFLLTVLTPKKSIIRQFLVVWVFLQRIHSTLNFLGKSLNHPVTVFPLTIQPRITLLQSRTCVSLIQHCNHTAQDRYSVAKSVNRTPVYSVCSPVQTVNTSITWTRNHFPPICCKGTQP